MFDVKFYTFQKKENSTARPADAGAREFSCVIRDESGIINPTIELELPLTEDPSGYNYAYIQNFDRYYNIEEWHFAGRLWTATLSVDVLATFKNEIGSHNLYVLRAANEYDGRITDLLYPTKSGCTFNRVNIDPIWSLNGGVYVVGVVNKWPDFGSIKYYILTPTDFGSIVSYLLSDDLLDDYNINVSDATNEFKKSLIDPLQYIKSCIYIPVPSSIVNQQYQLQNTVAVYSWTIGFQTDVPIARYVTPDKTKLSFNRTVSIPKHPQTAARGNYVNQKPYSNIQLMIPPFGVIEIDTTVINNADSIDIEVGIDMLTGLGILTISANGMILNRIEAQIGVGIQLSQVTRDYLGAATSAIGGFAGAVGSFTTGNMVGGFTSIASGIGDSIRALIPRSQTIGSGGSFAQLDATPVLDAQFFEIVDDDITQNGRPLCKIKTPASLGGYMLIQDGDVPCNGTAQEKRQIKNYLETGFYFE